MARIELLQNHIWEILLRQWKIAPVDVRALFPLDKHRRPIPRRVPRLIRETANVGDGLPDELDGDAEVHVRRRVRGEREIGEKEGEHGGVLHKSYQFQFCSEVNGTKKVSGRAHLFVLGKNRLRLLPRLYARSFDLRHRLHIPWKLGTQRALARRDVCYHQILQRVLLQRRGEGDGHGYLAAHRVPEKRDVLESALL